MGSRPKRIESSGQLTEHCGRCSGQSTHPAAVTWSARVCVFPPWHVAWREVRLRGVFRPISKICVGLSVGESGFFRTFMCYYLLPRVSHHGYSRCCDTWWTTWWTSWWLRAGSVTAGHWSKLKSTAAMLLVSCLTEKDQLTDVPGGLLMIQTQHRYDKLTDGVRWGLSGCRRQWVVGCRGRVHS